MRDPATRSLTVLDTTTSPAEANAVTRAPMWTAIPPTFALSSVISSSVIAALTSFRSSSISPDAPE